MLQDLVLKKESKFFFLDFEKEVKATIDLEMLIPVIKIDSELTFRDLINDQKIVSIPENLQNNKTNGAF